MKRFLLMTVAAIAVAISPVSAQEAEAPPELVTALKKRFPQIVEDNVWMDLNGGFKCAQCSLVWFETLRANWACNFTWGLP
jgi:hypothetical protein